MLCPFSSPWPCLKLRDGHQKQFRNVVLHMTWMPPRIRVEISHRTIYHECSHPPGTHQHHNMSPAMLRKHQLHVLPAHAHCVHQPTTHVLNGEICACVRVRSRCNKCSSSSMSSALRLVASYVNAFVALAQIFAMSLRGVRADHVVRGL